MTSGIQTPDQLTAEELIDLPCPSSVRISPTGKHVVYSVKPFGRKGDHEKSSIWIADFGSEQSARQLTSGSFNDRSPEWSPDGKSIAFISDREEAGKKCALYLLSISGGEAYTVTDPSNERSIGAFAWSPNEQFIAFTSADEKTEERKKKDENKDDVMVYGKEWQYNRLRLLHVATREVTVLFKEDAHVNSIAWRPDSKALMVETHKTTDINSPFQHGICMEIVSVRGRPKKTLLEFPGAITGGPVWTEVGLFFNAGVSANMISTAQVVYGVDLENGNYRVKAYGETDSAQDIRASFGTMSVQSESDLHSNITAWDGQHLLHSVEQYIHSYDVIKDGDGSHLTVFITSTVSTPAEVFCKHSSSGAVTQLSNHGHPVHKKVSAKYATIRCKSYDGAFDIDAVWATPASLDSSKPLPTVVSIHGGPPDRVTNSFEHFGYRWMPWIMSKNKYAILSPNYRGGVGRGDKFSAAAAGGMGTVEYDDILALIDEGIRRGLVDKYRLLVLGWSQGGFLSYLSAVRNGATTLPDGSPRTWKLKGAICGAGVTDWDMISMTSDAPAFESELAGGAPWAQEDKNWTKGRQGSAIWEFAAARKHIPPILILHGEKDERVPVTQAIAFHRGCLQWGLPCEFAVYPREPHNFRERAHLVDMKKRAARFIDTHLA